jgi:hypothetical protein
MSAPETTRDTPVTSEQWVDAFHDLAHEGIDDTIAHLAGARLALAELTEPDVAAALSSVAKAEAEAVGVRQAVAGAKLHWRAVLARHPAATGGTAASVVVGAVVAVWLCWPASVGAGAVTDKPVETVVCELIERREYEAAQKVISTEMAETARGMLLRCNLEQHRGNPDAARWWLERAAEAGDPVAVRVIKAKTSRTE